jgi:hypothetical protein
MQHKSLVALTVIVLVAALFGIVGVAEHYQPLFNYLGHTEWSSIIPLDEITGAIAAEVQDPKVFTISNMAQWLVTNASSILLLYGSYLVFFIFILLALFLLRKYYHKPQLPPLPMPKFPFQIPPWTGKAKLKKEISFPDELEQVNHELQKLRESEPVYSHPEPRVGVVQLNRELRTINRKLHGYADIPALKGTARTAALHHARNMVEEELLSLEEGYEKDLDQEEKEITKML